MLKKTIPWHSKKYRKFMSEQACCICGIKDDTVVGHHDRPPYHSSIGAKCSDVFMIPCCSKCHAEIHGGFFCQPHWVDFDKIRYELLNEFLCGLGEGVYESF